MIKGVNKQVLEILQPDNNYFEKAIFFVKPQYMGMSEGRLREIAKNELDGVGIPPKVKVSKKSKLKSFLIFFFVFSAGVILGSIFSAF